MVSEADDDVRYTEFMGKDNVPFHTVMFPATHPGHPASRGRRSTTSRRFNWLNYYGGKFSTSQQRGVFMDAALELLPADYWRYFLIANAPESDDASFTWEHVRRARSTRTWPTSSATSSTGCCPSPASGSATRSRPAARPGEPEREARRADRAACWPSTRTTWTASQFRKAAQALRALWSAGNDYLEEKAPWLAIKTDPDAAALTLRTAMNLIHLYAVVSEPFIPASARAMRAAFALAGRHRDLGQRRTQARALDSVPAGTPFTVPPVLFAKITEEDLAAFRERFGGSPEAVA